MGGTPTEAGYDVTQRTAQAWIFAGRTADVGSDDNLLSGMTFNYANRGVAGLIDELAGLNITPYSLVPIYDPTDFGEPIGDTYRAAERAMADIEDNSSDLDWSLALDTVNSGLTDVMSGLFTAADLSGAVSVFAVETEGNLLQEIAQINNLFADANTTGSSTRGLAVALVEREHLRGVDKYREALNLQVEDTKFKTIAGQAGQLAVEVARLAKKERVELLQAVTTMMGAAQLFSEGKRQSLNDQLRINIEDAMWELKLYDFANKSLSAINGAAVMPAHASPAMEQISTIASIAGSVAPLFAAFD